jgi:RNA polymerase sigma-70 factor, ECF subfamily
MDLTESANVTDAARIRWCMEPAAPSPLTPPDDLFQAVYAHLHDIASRHLAGNSGRTLTPTVLVHEAYLRLCRQPGGWVSRAHFLNTAALAMRHVLISYARARGRQKRGGGVTPLSLESDMAVVLPPDADVLALHDALTELAALDRTAADVVQLRYFGGVEWAEVAAVLGETPEAVRSAWTFARAWLFKRLSEKLPHD